MSPSLFRQLKIPFTIEAESSNYISYEKFWGKYLALLTVTAFYDFISHPTSIQSSSFKISHLKGETVLNEWFSICLVLLITEDIFRHLSSCMGKNLISNGSGWVYFGVHTKQNRFSYFFNQQKKVVGRGHL